MGIFWFTLSDYKKSLILKQTPRDIRLTRSGKFSPLGGFKEDFLVHNKKIYLTSTIHNH